MTAPKLLICVATLAMALASCNTIEGMGRDIKSTGKAIEKTAGDNK
jgi:predicted small secreted protein